MTDEAAKSAPPDDAALRARPFVSRFRMYLAERYPVIPGIVLAVMFGGTCDLVVQVRWGRDTGALWNEGDARLLLGTLTVLSCALVFLAFLLLRVLDEFKDFEEDRLAHPERVVQRGIVTLAELRVVGISVVAIMLALAAMLGARPLAAWVVVIAYAGLMAREFFIGAALRRSMLAYALSHQVIVPLVALACVTARLGEWPGEALYGWLALMTAGLGLGFEVGRKINSPEEEDPRDESYSQAWGARAACGMALGAMAVATGAAAMIARSLSLPIWASAVIGLGWLLAALGFAQFLRAPSPKTSKPLQGAAALASLFTYGGLIAGIIARHGVSFGA